MPPYTNATAHLYEGDIAFTDGIASRDEVTIYRATPHYEYIIYKCVLAPRTLLVPLNLHNIHWNSDLHMPYAYTQRDARKLADALANRYEKTFGVYNYEGDDATHYIVDTVFDIDDLRDITCYYRTDGK